VAVYPLVINTFWPQTFLDWAELAGIGITALAVLIAGIWTYKLFLSKRQKYPRAVTTHKIFQKSLGSRGCLLRVTVAIRNGGDVLLNLVSGEVRVHQILPIAPEFEDLLGKGEALVEEGRTHVDWPLLESRERQWETGKFEIEPGETDEEHFDFILENAVHTVEVYSYFKNEKKRDREIGWNLTTIHEIEPTTESGRTIDAHMTEG